MPTERTRIDTRRGRRMRTRRYEEEPTAVDDLVDARVSNERREHLAEQLEELPAIYEPAAPRAFMK